MCGIAGIIKLNALYEIPAEYLQKITQKIAHRGPDGEGFMFLGNGDVQTLTSKSFNLSESTPYQPKYYIEDFNNTFQVGLAHRRLSIIDLSEKGHQPMCSPDGRYWIVFNGEIYNYKELKSELVKKGIQFFSDTDTEVVLRLFELYGKSCVEMFNGMWAMAIYDKEENQLLLSRDRFGVKPLYYFVSENEFVFASEQKAVFEYLRISKYEQKINSQAVFDYFLFNQLEQKETGFFENIYELFPAHHLELNIKTKSINVTRYFNIKQITPDYSFKRNDWIEKIRFNFKQAVSLRLRSDVEVASCLSGGIDSSAIVMQCADLGIKNMQTFTYRNQEKEFNEYEYAQIVAQKAKYKLHIGEPDGIELLNNLENLVYAQDIPIWSTSTYAQFSLMKNVNNAGIKVVLDGQGGDELFAGYPHHLAHYYYSLYPAKQKEFAQNLSAEQLKFIKRYKTKWSFFNKWLPKFSARLQYQILLNFYADLRFLNKEFLLYHLDHNHKENHHFTNLDEQLRIECSNQLLKSYLKCEDRCSMYFSIESRTPFSDDTDLINTAFSIPADEKLKNGIHKSILKEALKEIIPKEILMRKDKMGFQTPNKKWIQEFSPIVLDKYFNNLNSNYLNKNEILKNWNNYINSKVSSSSPRIFKPIVFSIWENIFFGN